MLSKDIQEILEGVHYFLSETLAGECLPGKVECLRRGLVIQLEALALSYPCLHISCKKSPSPATFALLSVEQNNDINRTARPLSSSVSTGSSSSTAYSNSLSTGYSNNSSADGVIQQSNSASPDEELRLPALQNEHLDSESSGSGAARHQGEEKEESEDLYLDSAETIPFSTLIQTCDKHGVLSKKTKGLIKHLKSYLCVLSNGLLYLYAKDTDERQRKTIDLSEYEVKDGSSEDLKDNRKKSAAFELFGSGKKTHTFVASSANLKMSWIEAIQRVSSQNNKSSSPGTGVPPLEGTTPELTPSCLPSSRSGSGEGSSDTSFEQQEDAFGEDIHRVFTFNFQLYEEISDELSNISLFDSEYYEVPAENKLHSTMSTALPSLSVDGSSSHSSPSASVSSRRPPERPPLPAFFKEKLTGSRELIGDPQEVVDDLYSEIESPCDETSNSPLSSSQFINIIKKDFFPNDPPPLPERQPDLSAFRSTTPMVPEEEYDIPQKPEKVEVFKMPWHHRLLPKRFEAPPKLPPKGEQIARDNVYEVPPAPVQVGEENEGEYKVPPCSRTSWYVDSQEGSVQQPGEDSGSCNANQGLNPKTTPSSLPGSVETKVAMFSCKKIHEGKVMETLKTKLNNIAHPSGQFSPVKEMILRLNRQNVADDVGNSLGKEKKSSVKEKKELSCMPKSYADDVTTDHEVADVPSCETENIELRSSEVGSPQEMSDEVENKSDETADTSCNVINSASGEQERYVAMFAYVAEKSDALSFNRGDVMVVESKDADSGWWVANVRGKRGLVPPVYLKKNGQ